MTPDPMQDLQRQAAAADRAIAEQEAVRARRRPGRMRRWAPAVLVIALLALAASLYLQRDRLFPPPPDPVVDRQWTVASLTFFAGMVEGFHETNGRYPATLAELGLAEVPMGYAVTPAGYQLYAVTTAGDTVRLDGPRPADVTATPLRSVP
jgi:hypothetical protein